MISNEFIDKWSDKIDGIDEDINAFVAEIVALAQQVKEPVWRLVSGYMIAETEIGQYTIDHDAGYYTIIYHDIEYRVLYDTETEAIEAANADYRKRVLSCLVWGAV